MFTNTVSAAIMALPLMAAAAPTSAPQTYKLKTKVLDGPTSLDGLFVEAYHTGAGMNDAVLTPDPSTAAAGFLNETAQQFNLGSQAYTLALPTSVFYTNWQAATIPIGPPTFGEYAGAFYNNASAGGLWYNSRGTVADPQANITDNTFEGWLACYWWHQDRAQIFFLMDGATSEGSYPSTCGKVQLEMNYTD